MPYAPYTNLEATPDFATFQFISPTLPDATVRQVRFNGQFNGQQGGRIYHVDFRNKTTDRRDDPSWPDSKDFFCTVLTVLQIIEIYSERYPGRILLFNGDSMAKALVFGTIAGRFHHLLAPLFDVEAETSGPGRDGGKERCYPLTGGAEERDRSYLFLVKRKPFPCFSISTVESIWNGTSQIFHNRFSIKLDKRVRIGLTLPTA
jgi:hypothetical protein